MSDKQSKSFLNKPSDSLQINIESLISDNIREGYKELVLKAGENKILIDGQYYVNEELFNSLYSHQKEGVRWLYKLFKAQKGGILADDLGKTTEMIFFLRELFESDSIKSALIVMPKSLLISWELEFKKLASKLNVLMYTGKERTQNLNIVRESGGILLTTYATILNNFEELKSDSKFKFNVLGLDEGHIIKNSSSKTFKAIKALKTDMRVVMTGYPVQNTLKELWSLFDFTHNGSLLGNYPTFKKEYETPITTSRNKNAKQTEKACGDEKAEKLKNKIKPYFLRRTKEEVTEEAGLSNTQTLGRKNELIVWIKMTDIQKKFYKKFLESAEIKRVLTKSHIRFALAELNILKKICDHPRLLPPAHYALMEMSFAGSSDQVDIKELQPESGKMEFLLLLLKEFDRTNHKCLFFSQRKVMLNIIQKILENNKIFSRRIDGDIKPKHRQQQFNSFKDDANCKVLLLTSQVSLVGLTMTGVDRIVIYDLSWNPYVDAQAVNRFYRIGQSQNLVVYRLITGCTIEEKIYRRQIFKDSVNRKTIGIQSADKDPTRHFNNKEINDLYILDNSLVSETQIELENMHSQFRTSDKELDQHIAWLKNRNIYGLSDHNLMFSHEEEEIVEVDKETRDETLTSKDQSGNCLFKESPINVKAEERQSQIMNKMSINDYKSKTKKKHFSETLFIPSSSDLKRPVHHIIQSFQSQIPEYFQPTNIKKPSKVEYNQISGEDNTIIVDEDNKNQKEDAENMKKSLHIDEKMKLLEYEEGDDTYVYEEFEDKNIEKPEEENILKIINKQYNEFVTNEDDYLHEVDTTASFKCKNLGIEGSDHSDDDKENETNMTASFICKNLDIESNDHSDDDRVIEIDTMASFISKNSDDKKEAEKNASFNSQDPEICLSMDKDDEE